MIVTKLKLNYFGRFQNREIELKPGINLIYGENEAGKSTIHTFIRGMLFGIERLRGRGAASKEDIYTRYLPWDYPGAYGGSMDIRIGDKDYRLQRSFHANDKSFCILDLSTGRELKGKEDTIKALIPGLTESAYRNTVSIEQQRAATDTELAAQVRNYIANLSIAKSNEVNVTKAISLLMEQRKQLEAALDPTKLKALKEEIEEGLVREERIDRLTMNLREYLLEEQRIIQQKEQLLSEGEKNLAEQMEQLPVILEKYSSYQELIRQEKHFEQQELELKTKRTELEKVPETAANLKNDIARLQKLHSDLNLMDRMDMELQGRKKRLTMVARRNVWVSLVPGIVLGILTGAVTGFQETGIRLSLALLLAGILGFVLLSLAKSKQQRALHTEAIDIELRKSELQDQIRKIQSQYGVSHTEELVEKQEAVIRDTYALEHLKEQQQELIQKQKELEDQKDHSYDMIMKYMQQFIVEEELTDGAMAKLREYIRKIKSESTDRLELLNRQQENARLGIQKLRWEIEALEGNEEELLKNKERYLELEQNQKEVELELEAVKLALSTIQELSVGIHDSFGQQLNTAVTKVISDITGQKYQELKVDEKLEVKVGCNGEYILLDRLSAGTIDQVYFALRTAVAELLLGRDEIPLILDDSFAFYDETRVKAALKELSNRKQVLLFTCHRREGQLLDELGLPYHLVEL